MILPELSDELQWDELLPDTKRAVLQLGFSRGHTSLQLAERFGCSKGKVTGFAFRAGIKASDYRAEGEAAEALEKIKKVRRLPGAKDQSTSHRLKFLNDKEAQAKAHARLEDSGLLSAFDSEVQEHKPLTILELKDCHCRWPFGSGSGATYCGRLKQDGSSYCEFHHKRAYTTGLRIDDQ